MYVLTGIALSKSAWQKYIWITLQCSFVKPTLYYLNEYVFKSFKNSVHVQVTK
jgi:hypothetical protein